MMQQCKGVKEALHLSRHGQNGCSPNQHHSWLDWLKCGSALQPILSLSQQTSTKIYASGNVDGLLDILPLLVCSCLQLLQLLSKLSLQPCLSDNTRRSAEAGPHDWWHWTLTIFLPPLISLEYGIQMSPHYPVCSRPHTRALTPYVQRIHYLFLNREPLEGSQRGTLCLL